MNPIALLAAALLSACSQSVPRQQVQIDYGILRSAGPVVFLLATDIENTLNGASTINPLAADLHAAGFTVVSLDLPCHGKDGDTNTALACWRTRIEAGQDIFTPFCTRLSAVIDALAVRRVSAVGLSRGAYAAFTCAAKEPRIGSIVGLSPLTDLARLTEFAGMPSAPAPMLSGHSILIRIGPDDTRVGTDLADAYAHAIGAEFEIVQDAQNHFVPDHGVTVQWLKRH